MLKPRGQWGPIYMLIVVVIAAVLLITLIKPIVIRASQSASETIDSAEVVAKAALLLIS